MTGKHVKLNKEEKVILPNTKESVQLERVSTYD